MWYLLSSGSLVGTHEIKIFQVVTVNFDGHGQSCPKYPSNISKKKWGMKLIFCTNKHQSFLQVDTIIFDGHDQGSFKHSKSQVSNIFPVS